MRNGLSIAFGSASMLFGGCVVMVTALISPLQDWDGNTSDPDEDRVLVMSALLTATLVTSLIGVLVIRSTKGNVRSGLLVAQDLVLVAALLLGLFMWFPYFSG